MEIHGPKKDLDWLFNLKAKIPKFLNNLKGKKRKGFYHYSLTGDYFGENFKWGLGNSVFLLKTLYTLNCESIYQQEIQDAINFINSFQRKNGVFYDPLVWLLSTHKRIKNGILNRNLKNILNQQTIRAETRQSLSVLYLLGRKPKYHLIKIPNNIKKVDKFLSSLDWKWPWNAGSHFSHLLFMLYHSKFKDKNKLIQYAIDWVNKLQHEEDGFWYKGSPDLKQKINGAMKIITGLKVVNKLKFKFPDRIIDNALLATCDAHACDNFNISYVLKYCNEITDFNYRYDEIEDFMYDRLDKYQQYYYPEIGGFSFLKNQASRNYYGAIISRGKKEPDIHGTVIFLWGISIIAQVLKINDDLQFKEFIT